MRRRSERGKTKPTKEEEEAAVEKTPKLPQRQSRRRKKSSSDEDVESPTKNVEPIAPLEIQVHDIELPVGEKPAASSDKQDTNSEFKSEWKEDTSFWESGASKPEPTTSVGEAGDKEKEESSLWKVQSSNGASAGGEIQKLKICRQKPQSPEIGETSLHKRLSRGTKDNRSTDESTHEEMEKESKKSKHRTRTSSRNSPLVSPTVVCDVTEGSPTKIKIINVGHINADSKVANSGKSSGEKSVSSEEQNKSKSEQKETVEVTSSPKITLPHKKTPTTDPVLEKEAVILESLKETEPISAVIETSIESQSQGGMEHIKENETNDDRISIPSKTTSPQPTPCSEDEDGKKKEADHCETSDKEDQAIMSKENEVNNTASVSDNLEEVNETREEQPRMPRKRRWGSSKANRQENKTVLTISTDSLKSILPDAKPVPTEELQLSVEEEEEGQLEDDEVTEDEVAALMGKQEENSWGGPETAEDEENSWRGASNAKEEGNSWRAALNAKEEESVVSWKEQIEQHEKEKRKEERQKEREKELEDRKKRREERQSRFEKNKPEHPTPSEAADKISASRKILLLSDDAKKLARSPSPPRHRPSNVLFITNLVRPFTVQLLKNLLLRTGTIAENGFWIDKIKSKCYVEYTTEDMAVETRHALHGVRWPTSNPKTLVVEFASKDDLIMAQALAEEPDVPRKAEPLNMVEGWVADQAKIRERNRKIIREWDVGKPEHPDEALEYEMKMKEKEKKELERKYRKERHHHSPTPEAELPARKSRRKEEDAPAKLLDDLFRKTKSSPCIYWLPLSPEQIAVKEEMRRQHMAEHERRMAELKKMEQSRRDRERRSRK